MPFIIITLIITGYFVSHEVNIVSTGIALFLLGMIYLEKGFKFFTGGILEKLLKQFTNNVFKSLSVGVLSTAILQSSSLISVVIISFLSVGLITLTQSIGIIFGANLGSTLSTWLIALYGIKINLANFTMPILITGVLLKLQSNAKWKGFSYIALGIAFLFLGVDFIKNGFENLSQSIDLTRYALTGTTGLLTYTFIGIIIATLMQSTNAAMVIILSALSLNQLSYENAIAITIGCNIGTTSTAIIGAIKASSDGKRLAAAHVLFNTITAFIAIIFISPLSSTVNFLAETFGILEHNYTIKLAIFHTLFNLMGICLLLPFIKLMIKILHILFTDDEKNASLDQNKQSKAIRALYLNTSSQKHPDTAITAIIKESAHLYNNTLNIICYSVLLTKEQIQSTHNLKQLTISSDLKDSRRSINELYIKNIKSIYADIIQYSSNIQVDLSKQQHQKLFALQIACRNFIQAIKHVTHIHNNMKFFLSSKKKHAYNQYNQLRICLVSVLRSIYFLEEKNNPSYTIQQLKQQLKKQDKNISTILHKLIKMKKIDSYTASSLLNDSAHVHDACTYLIDGAEILSSKK